VGVSELTINQQLAIIAAQQGDIVTAINRLDDRYEELHRIMTERYDKLLAMIQTSMLEINANELNIGHATEQLKTLSDATEKSIDALTARVNVMGGGNTLLAAIAAAMAVWLKD